MWARSRSNTTYMYEYRIEEVTQQMNRIEDKPRQHTQKYNIVTGILGTFTT